MAILESNKPVTLTQREVAVLVAKAIAKTGLPVPNGQFRNDVDYIQIDPIIIEKCVTQPKPGVRLQFMTEARFGVAFNVNLEDFEKDPVGTLKDLFDHLYPMLRNGQKMRHNKRLLDAAMYDILTRETAANG
jgi:hypothetical protein